MRTLWTVVVVVVLSACGGVEGPPGPAGPPGPGGVTFVSSATDATIPWAFGPREGWEFARMLSFSGRAGMPADARNVLLNIDLCAGGGLSASNGGFAMFNGEDFEALDAQRLFATEQCRLPASFTPGDEVPNFDSFQLWVPLVGSQEVKLRSSGETYLIRVRLLAWAK